jgi:host factor-I protein
MANDNNIEHVESIEHIENIEYIENIENIENVEPLEYRYLDKLCAQQIYVAVYLINGIKLSGLIEDFDDKVVVLKDAKNTSSQLLYKHAISTIVPAKAAFLGHEESVI